MPRKTSRKHRQDMLLFNSGLTFFCALQIFFLFFIGICLFFRIFIFEVKIIKNFYLSPSKTLRVYPRVACSTLPYHPPGINTSLEKLVYESWWNKCMIMNWNGDKNNKWKNAELNKTKSYRSLQCRTAEGYLGILGTRHSRRPSRHKCLRWN